LSRGTLSISRPSSALSSSFSPQKFPGPFSERLSPPVIRLPSPTGKPSWRSVSGPLLGAPFSTTFAIERPLLRLSGHLSHSFCSKSTRVARPLWPLGVGGWGGCGVCARRCLLPPAFLLFPFASDFLFLAVRPNHKRVKQKNAGGQTPQGFPLL